MEPAPIRTSFATGRQDLSAAQTAMVSVITMRAPTAVWSV